MINNLTLFEHCLKPENKEPLIDEYYCNDGLIISRSPDENPTELMRANQRLLEQITVIKVALEEKNLPEIEKRIRLIATLLQEKNINFTEFTSFFPTIDVSYSIYSGLPETEKLEFLRHAVPLYIHKRHGIYTAHGYSATTLQVRKDFEKHKTGGNAANVKVADLLRKAGMSQHTKGQSFIGTRSSYVFLDDLATSNRIFEELKEVLGLKFIWQAEHQNKSADLIFSNTDGQIFICEFKHMKESGGGQDKQVAELISLISHGEVSPKIGYIAFLDGIYFNAFVHPKARKTKEQVTQIKQYLTDNPNNFFVNTFGFQQLIST